MQLLMPAGGKQVARVADAHLKGTDNLSSVRHETEDQIVTACSFLWVCCKIVYFVDWDFQDSCCFAKLGLILLDLWGQRHFSYMQ